MYVCVYYVCMYVCSFAINKNITCKISQKIFTFSINKYDYKFGVTH